MKKYLALVICACMLSGVMTGCASAKPQPTAAATVPPTAAPQTQATQPPTETSGVTLEHQVIYDKDGVRISVTGLEEDAWTGAKVWLMLENNTDQNLLLTGDVFVVNGITVQAYLYAEVAAGMKANDSLELFTDVLDASGITEIATIRGYDTRIVDSDSLDTVAKVPLSLETSIAETHTQEIDDSGEEIFSEAGVTVIAQVISEEFYGQTVQLLVKNETGKDIIVEAENISVNGFTLDAWLYDTVCRDTVRFSQLDLFASGLADNGIEAVETVTFTLRILDDTTYETIAKSDVLTVSAAG